MQDIRLTKQDSAANRRYVVSAEIAGSRRTLGTTTDPSKAWDFAAEVTRRAGLTSYRVYCARRGLLAVETV